MFFHSNHWTTLKIWVTSVKGGKEQRHTTVYQLPNCGQSFLNGQSPASFPLISNPFKQHLKIESFGIQWED